MADVKLMINGRPYSVGCDAGEERRVIELGQYLDARTREIGRATGTSDENHLLVLASLMITNELQETASRLEQALINLKNGPEPRTIIQTIEVPVEVPVEVQVMSDMPAAANDAQIEEMGEMVQQLSQRVASLANRIKTIG